MGTVAACSSCDFEGNPQNKTPIFWCKQHTRNTCYNCAPKPKESVVTTKTSIFGDTKERCFHLICGHKVLAKYVVDFIPPRRR
jgi:hypothetical protein